MYDKKTNTITFPHIIIRPFLAGREYTFNDIHGGIFPIAKFNLVVDSFLGGNVDLLGLIKDYGFYLCPDRFDKQRIRGFYFPDPDMLTDAGKRLLEQHYKGVTIVYEKVSATPHKAISSEDMQKKIELIQEAKKYGVQAYEVDGASLKEVEGVLKAAKSGKSGTQTVVENRGVSQVDDADTNVKHKTPIRKGAR